MFASAPCGPTHPTSARCKINVTITNPSLWLVMHSAYRVTLQSRLAGWCGEHHNGSFYLQSISWYPFVGNLRLWSWSSERNSQFHMPGLKPTTDCLDFLCGLCCSESQGKSANVNPPTLSFTSTPYTCKLHANTPPPPAAYISLFSHFPIISRR